MSKFVEKSHKVRPFPDLKDMITHSAETYGDRIAYYDRREPGEEERKTVTFRELKEQMDALGTSLIAKGMKDQKIVVIGENRYHWALSYFAVINGVGVVVPLDRELPHGEIRNLLIRSEAAMIIYSGKLEKTILQAAEGLETVQFMVNMDSEEHTWRMLSLSKLIEEGKELIEKGDHRYLDAVIDNHALAAILFTSGTTGSAKGVMMSHRNFTSNVENMLKRMHITPEDKILLILPIHHSYQWTCAGFSAIHRGTGTVFFDGLKYIQKNLKEDEITVLLGVPLVFETFHKKIFAKAKADGKEGKLRSGMKINSRLQKIHLDMSRKIFKDIYNGIGEHIRVFISGASGINPQVIEDFRALGINMFQGYGLTECAPIVAVNADYCSRPASVGPAMPGTEIRIFEPDGDGIGEIICKSESVMLGYYEDPEETAKVLKDGWFYTGDYGYVDKDGFVYITGRKKNVIVTKNGKNIYPEELEALLEKSEYIQESMVWGREDDESGEVYITAEIVVQPEAGEKIPEEELRKLIKQVVEEVNKSTPSYKRIKKFNLRYEEFEKTTTKKIKRYKVQVGEEDH